jgi:hypothetical protein
MLDTDYINTCVSYIICLTQNNIEKSRIVKKNSQNDKIENIASSVCRSLFIDGSGNWNLSSTSNSLAASLNIIMMYFEFRNIRSCVHTAVIMKRLMWLLSWHSLKSDVWSPSDRLQVSLTKKRRKKKQIWKECNILGIKWKD